MPLRFDGRNYALVTFVVPSALACVIRVEHPAEQIVDIVQPDICHAGGILELKKIAAMAEAGTVAVLLPGAFLMLREAPLEMDAARARALADRRTGIGCDQLILLEPSATADVRMRIWNSDGGEAESCGNAARCVALLEGAPHLLAP